MFRKFIVERPRPLEKKKSQDNIASFSQNCDDGG